MTINATRKIISLTGPNCSFGNTNACRVDVVAAGSTWQLASGHWVPRKFDAVIAHPRPTAETAVYEQHRNAYPGLAYSTRVLVFGGAYPFRYELVTGPSGMTIGETLVASGDVLVEPSNYGMVEWANPTAGDHTVTVRVYDQDYGRTGNPSGYVEVTWTLTVGTGNWVFIDPVNGNNANAGTLAAPFADTTPFITGSTYANKCVMVRQGTMNLVGMGSSDYDAGSTAPKVFVGYPGETATIAFNSGHFRSESASGFCLRKLTLRHSDTTYGNSQQMLLMRSADTGRHVMTDCNITQFKNGGDDSGNPGVFVSASTSGPHEYICFAYNTLSGLQGAGFHTYSAKNAVCHGNVWANCTFSQADPSNTTMIFCKVANVGVTVRANQCWENNTWSGSLSGVIGFSAGDYAWTGASYGLDKYEACWNRFYYSHTSLRDAALRVGKNDINDGADNIHIYRNSFGLRDNVEWNTTPVYNSSRQNNILNGGATLDTGFGGTDSNNLDTGTYLDSSLRLTGASRSSYLGTHGAEIA